MDIPGIQHRIVKYLPAYLLKHGIVDIEDFGRFYLRSHNSFVDYADKKVYPPWYDVHFERYTDHRADEYIAYLADRSGLEVEMIAEMMGSWKETMIRQLQESGSYYIKKIGKLSLEDGDQISFLSDDQYWGFASIKVLGVEFTPVPRMKEESDLQQVTSITSSEPLKDEHTTEINEELQDDFDVDDWEETESLNDEQEEMGDAESLEESTFETEVDTRQEVAVGSDQKVTSHDEEKRRHRTVLWLMLVLICLILIPTTYYLWPDQSDVSSTTPDVATDRLNQSPETHNQDAPESDEAAESDIRPIDEEETSREAIDEIAEDPDILSIQDEENEAHTTEEIEDDPPTSSSEPDQSSQPNRRSLVEGQCVIVVGAFGQGDNMRRMMRDLKSRGFEVYVDSSRALSRVGVYSSCKSSELEANLSLIRSEVEPGAWPLNQ